jgi:peroxiredoxin family protein
MAKRKNMKVAMMIHNGSSENIRSAFNTAIMAATAGAKVSMLFRSWALEKLARQNIDELELPPQYAHRKKFIEEGWKRIGYPPLSELIKDAKEKLDIKIYACTASNALFNLKKEDLPLVDDYVGVYSFLEKDAFTADVVLTY